MNLLSVCIKLTGLLVSFTAASYSFLEMRYLVVIHSVRLASLSYTASISFQAV